MFLQVKIELCAVLLSNCFHEICGSTFAHINFTARAQDNDQAKKSLYFAELRLDPDLLAKKLRRFAELSLHDDIVGCAEDIEPMCVVSIHKLERSCFGMFIIVALFIVFSIYCILTNMFAYL